MTYLPSLMPIADNRDKGREDAPLRVLVAFDGDKTTLPAGEQKRFPTPVRSRCWRWPLGRRAWGAGSRCSATSPPITGVPSVPRRGACWGCDTDNTGTQAIGEYADIRLDCAGS